MRSPLFLAPVIAGLLAAPALAQVSAHPTPQASAKSAPVKDRPKAAIPAAKPYAKGQQPLQPRSLQPVPAGVSYLVGGSDACTTPDVIAGTGTFAFDNTTATTGPQGQLEGACNFFGQTDILSDVWFTWTATATGNFELNTCGITSVDTKIAVYDGAGCPTSAALACNDDNCPGFQSTLLFPAIAGNAYTIQVGLYPGQFPPAVPGAGVFSLVQVAAPANDDCTAPTAISGLGTFSFDNTYATAGTQGQSEALCSSFGSTALPNDVWFDWTSTTTGVVSLATCGGFVDTKVSVYQGAGCPTSAAIACNDDACGLQTKLSFSAVAGQTYSIQVGLYPFTTQGGADSFTIALPPANDVCTAPVILSGPGTFPFDNTFATTGTQGQNEGLCLAFGNTNVTNDVWYRWTSTFTGTAGLDTCASGVDTKIAIYAGQGCPAGSALACNDDFCFLQTRVLWNVVAGNRYTIQLGTYPNGGGAAGGVGTFDVYQVIVPANDACTTPTAISGVGPHAFDNAFATTGVEGQGNSNCNFFANTNITYDVWYSWTATSTSTTLLSFCGQTNVDTKVAVYAGTGCPAGTAIACNDDKCGLISELCFDAVAGNVYTIQVGTYPNGGGAPGGAGTFTLTPNVPGGTNDDCQTPTVIAGLGPHAYDNSSATTGCQGQDSAACNFFGSSSIDNDLWFRWTAPSTGTFQVTQCGLAGGADTKIAIYSGSGCPTTNAIACDDDGCGFVGGESQSCFDVIGGNVYTVQVGNFPGTFGGPGAFQFSPLGSLPACQHDNGTSENSVGLTAGGAVASLHRFGAIGQTGTVTSISAAWGSPLFPGGAPGAGTPVIAAVWDDPNDDGDPTDCVLLQQVAGVVTNVDNDLFDVYSLSGAQTVSGIYFVGVSVVHAAGQFPLALDQNGCPANSNGRAWVVGSTAGTLDVSNLAANDVPPQEMDAIGLPGVWLLRASCTSGPPGTGYCFGDGTGLACPCGNTGGAGRGCANSLNPAGALLAASGSASLGSDSLTLLGTGMPNATCLYFQGTAASGGGNGVIFGDGLRCAAGQVLRLGTKTNVAGASQYPVGGDLTISQRAASASPPQPISAGQTRYYQVWYRNAAAFCTVSTFNLSNGLQVVWTN